MKACLYFLNIKKRRAIFELVLHDDANCFKASLVFVKTMAESTVKASKVFESGIECLMASPSTALEMTQLLGIVSIRGAYDPFLATVPIVSNDYLAIWNHIF